MTLAARVRARSAPSGGDHFRVLTPYWNRWRALPRRAHVPKPRRLVLPSGLAAGALPERRDLSVARHHPS